MKYAVSGTGCIVAMVALVITLPAYGSGEPDFWHDKARGWFWYEPEPQEQEKKPRKSAKPEKKEPEKVETVKLEPVRPPSPKPEQTKSKEKQNKPLSAQWLRENIQKYRDKAWNNPTPDNVTAFLAMQQYMLDRSAEFSAVSKQVTVANPQLDASSYRPVTGDGRIELKRQAAESRRDMLSQTAEKAGLWFFYRGSTSHSVEMAELAASLKNRFDFAVLPISLDGQKLPQELEEKIGPSRINNGQAEKLSVSVEPAFVLMGKDGAYSQVAQGMLALPDLKSRMLIVSYQNKWIDKSQFDKTQGLLTPSGTYARQFESEALSGELLNGDVSKDPEKDVPIDPEAIVTILKNEVNL